MGNHDIVEKNSYSPRKSSADITRAYPTGIEEGEAEGEFPGQKTA